MSHWWYRQLCLNSMHTEVYLTINTNLLTWYLVDLCKESRANRLKCEVINAIQSRDCASNSLAWRWWWSQCYIHGTTVTGTSWCYIRWWLKLPGTGWCTNERHLYLTINGSTDETSFIYHYLHRAKQKWQKVGIYYKTAVTKPKQ